jgi:hypothetical protein
MEIILFEKGKLEAIHSNLTTPRSPFMCVLSLELQYRVQFDIELKHLVDVKVMTLLHIWLIMQLVLCYVNY